MGAPEHDDFGDGFPGLAHVGRVERQAAQVGRKTGDPGGDGRGLGGVRVIRDPDLVAGGPCPGRQQNQAEVGPRRDRRTVLGVGVDQEDFHGSAAFRPERIASA